MENIKSEKVKFIASSLIMMALAIFINCCGCVSAEKFHIPLYLDSLLTIGVVASCGLVPGFVCALFSNLLLTYFDYTMLPFVSCHILTAFFAWLTFNHFAKKDSRKLSLDAFLWAGFWSGLSNAVLGNIIADTLFFSNTETPRIDITVQGIYIALDNLHLATYLAGTIENLTDKTISAVLSFGLYKFYKKVI